MLDIQHITYSYGRRIPAVVQDLDLHLEGGHIYGLLGKNGAGKSTLLYLMCGLLRPQQGTVTLHGMETWRRRPDTLSDIYLVPEQLLPSTLSIATYCRINAPFYPRFDHDIFAACLADFDLQPSMRLDRLSMGQTKKAHMSFAFATGARLILMDEPTNGLDIPSKSLFRQVLARHLRDDQAVVISTHQVLDVQMLLDHLIMLHEGRILLNSSIEAICRAVRFEQRQAGEPGPDVFYAEPTPGGQAVIVRNDGEEEESQLNLELLFNALESKRLTAADLVLRDATSPNAVAAAVYGSVSNR